MTDTELTTTFILAHTDWYGHLKKTRTFLKEYGYISSILGKSRFYRRLHELEETIWHKLITYAATQEPIFGLPNEFVVGIFPMRVCHKVRMNRSRLFYRANFIGYNACWQRPTSLRNEIQRTRSSVYLMK